MHSVIITDYSAFCTMPLIAHHSTKLKVRAVGPRNCLRASLDPTLKRPITNVMALSYKSRRRLSLLILLVGLPAYVVVSVTIIGLFDRPPFWLELVIYLVLGVLWALPFKAVFKGVGKADPDEIPDETS